MLKFLIEKIRSDYLVKNLRATINSSLSGARSRIGQFINALKFASFILDGVFSVLKPEIITFEVVLNLIDMCENVTVPFVSETIG